MCKLRELRFICDDCIGGIVDLVEVKNSDVIAKRTNVCFVDNHDQNGVFLTCDVFC